jgi:hypothetical protein
LSVSSLKISNSIKSDDFLGPTHVVKSCKKEGPPSSTSSFGVTERKILHVTALFPEVLKVLKGCEEIIDEFNPIFSIELNRYNRQLKNCTVYSIVAYPLHKRSLIGI